MKRLILFFILAMLAMYMFGSCSNDKPKPDPKVHYINMDCIIVEKIPATTGINTRSTSKAFLIRSIKDSLLYCEFIDLDFYEMKDSTYYNHNIGDTLHFDYILKSRFFRKN